jgi:hypothetical protein
MLTAIFLNPLIAQSRIEGLGNRLDRLKNLRIEELNSPEGSGKQELKN